MVRLRSAGGLALDMWVIDIDCLPRRSGNLRRVALLGVSGRGDRALLRRRMERDGVCARGTNLGSGRTDTSVNR